MPSYGRSLAFRGGFGTDQPISSRECVNLVVSVNVIGWRNRCLPVVYDSLILADKLSVILRNH